DGAPVGPGGGSRGPVGIDVEVIADEALRDGQYVAGANRDGWHLLAVEAGRGYAASFRDLRGGREGRTQRAAQTSARRAKAIGAPCAAAPSASRSRSRSVTSSSSTTATPRH